MNTVALEYSMYICSTYLLYVCIQDVLISLKIATKHETQCNYKIFTNIQTGNILSQVFEKSIDFAEIGHQKPRSKLYIQCTKH